MLIISTIFVNDNDCCFFRLDNAINREQEIAGPMVCSHLAGWGEKLCSHKYSPIYWSSFVGILLHYFPALKNGQEQYIFQNETSLQNY